MLLNGEAGVPDENVGRQRKPWWRKAGAAAMVRLLLIVALLGIRIGDAINPGPLGAGWDEGDPFQDLDRYLDDPEVQFEEELVEV